MNEATKKEDAWLAAATAAAVAGARKIALNSVDLPIMTPIRRLNDAQWGWIVTAAVFAWVQTRCEQAISEGLSQEEMARATGLTPSPCDVAVVRSVLPAIADKAGIDWQQPLAVWSKDTMVNFLLLAWQLIDKAEVASNHGPNGVLRKRQRDWKVTEGDPIPFVPGKQDLS